MPPPGRPRRSSPPPARCPGRSRRAGRTPPGRPARPPPCATAGPAELCRQLRRLLQTRTDELQPVGSSRAPHTGRAAQQQGPLEPPAGDRRENGAPPSIRAPHRRRRAGQPFHGPADRSLHRRREFRQAALGRRRRPLVQLRQSSPRRRAQVADPAQRVPAPQDGRHPADRRGPKGTRGQQRHALRVEMTLQPPDRRAGLDHAAGQVEPLGGHGPPGAGRQLRDAQPERRRFALQQVQPEAIVRGRRSGRHRDLPPGSAPTAQDSGPV